MSWHNCDQCPVCTFKIKLIKSSWSFKLRSKCSRKHQALKLPEAKQKCFYQNLLDRVATLPKPQERCWIRIFLKRRKSAFSDHGIAKNSMMLLCKRLHCRNFHSQVQKKIPQVEMSRLCFAERNHFHCIRLLWKLKILINICSLVLSTWNLECNDNAENNQHWCQIWHNFPVKECIVSVFLFDKYLLSPFKVRLKSMKDFCRCKFTVMQISEGFHPFRFLGSIIQGGQLTRTVCASIWSKCLLWKEKCVIQDPQAAPWGSGQI